MQSTMQKIPGIGDIPIRVSVPQQGGEQGADQPVDDHTEILQPDSTGVVNNAAAHAGHVHAAGQREAGEGLAAAAGVHASLALAG
jgi:hypothetical protein